MNPHAAHPPSARRSHGRGRVRRVPRNRWIPNSRNGDVGEPASCTEASPEEPVNRLSRKLQPFRGSFKYEGLTIARAGCKR